MLTRLRRALSTTATGVASRQLARQKKFAHVVEALKAFQQENGHFVVPSDHQMDLKRGEMFPLGKKFQGLIRKLGQLSEQEQMQLTSIGFPMDWQSYYLRHAVIPALATYGKIHGHLRVPQSFIVPDDDLMWPSITWGLRLGNRVNHIRQHAQEMDAEDIEVLDDMGFVWNIHWDRRHNLTLPALEHFKKLHGHVHVPLKFQIPFNDPAWPSELHGFQLGHALTAIRAAHQKNQLDEDISTQLNNLGVKLNESRIALKWNERIFPALQKFVALYGHCDVPQHFIVPAKDIEWPEASWGLPLGRIVRDMRHIGLYSNIYDKSSVNALGFLWTREDRLQFQVHQRVLPALQTYKNIYDHLFIPTSFIIPSTPSWPLLTHGFHLGEWIARRRVDIASLPHDLQFLLEEIGIVWRHFDARFENILLPAFELYAKLHGSCAHMSTTFEVPTMLPWPPELWGLNLGGALWHIRNGDTYVSDPKKLHALKRCGVFDKTRRVNKYY